MRRRSYRYVGPPELAALVRPDAEGRLIRSVADLDDWAGEPAEPVTFVVDLDGLLRVASRRSEHVVCAGGRRVLSAGEMRFSREAGHWVVAEVSNQSTGYCPDTSSWPAVAEALDRAGLAHPPGFTHAVVFRGCPRCRELNIVREDDFVCVFCEADLPEAWNVDPLAD
ncbi:hypothetical protein [Herbidospora daliensis]|uniref:hypothetical protein n=1 Tax=Herbidospora daliensis TaxID=295585 RepID=UPI000B06BF9D|nr:hypothetical protein [Herbidospora daliensis]